MPFACAFPPPPPPRDVWCGGGALQIKPLTTPNRGLYPGVWAEFNNSLSTSLGRRRAIQLIPLKAMTLLNITLQALLIRTEIFAFIVCALARGGGGKYDYHVATGDTVVDLCCCCFFKR